ncbi:MAG: YggS family pyridoxal phosphate-dependent enzyme [Nitrosomonadales bacterium]
MHIENYVKLKKQIQLFSQELNIPEPLLVVVTKKQTINKIIDLINLGHKSFGENYLQEGLEKINKINNSEIDWHFIGPIQSNKTKLITENFNWIHSIDRIKTYNRIKDEALIQNKKINFLIQVNTSNEDSKSGIQPEKLDEFILTMDRNKNMLFRGIMSIPSNTSDANILKQEFNLMNKLFNKLKQNFPEVDTLSMGMSQDFQLAIKSGATMLRIGTKIFGERT